MFRSFSGVVLICLVLAVASSASVASVLTCTRPGSLAFAEGLSDGAQTVLDAVVYRGISGNYLLVSEPTDKDIVLPVLTDVRPPELASLEITGTMATDSGVRIVVPTRIRLYSMDAEGDRPFRFFPKSLTWAYDWRYMIDLMPQSASAHSTEFAASAQPLDAQPLDSTQWLNPPAGSIASVKLGSLGANVNLSGKIVTAAFPDCFYIEEPNRTCGIKVKPANSAIGPGEIVTVTGTAAVEADGAESYINASNV